MTVSPIPIAAPSANPSSALPRTYDPMVAKARRPILAASSRRA